MIKNKTKVKVIAATDHQQSKQRQAKSNRQLAQETPVEVVWRSDIKQSRFCPKKTGGVLEIKVDKPEKMNQRRWIIFIRGIIRLAKAYGIKKMVIDWEKITDFQNLSATHLGQLWAEAVEMANYDFRRYKSKPKEGWSDVQEIIVVTGGKSMQIRELKRQIKKGLLIGAGVNYARELANISGGDLTPLKLEREAKKAIKNTAIKMQVLDEKAMRRLKLNGVLAVGQGSKEPSRFLILKYQPLSSAKKPVVLVGKGVTFDSGGIDTKPHPHALEMMMDMSGAASVLATILLADRLKLKRKIIALIPAVENMPSGNSMRPGDVVKMHNGLNVEIRHTDAEGRLILADALAYAERFKPETVIDVATLTGASLVALGAKASALMTRDSGLRERLVELAEQTGDYVWPLPLWEEYEQDIVSERADIANTVTKAKPGEGGVITAGIFLWNFAKKMRWAHLDIAPRMVADYQEQLAKGAAGPAVRLLTAWLTESV